MLHATAKSEILRIGVLQDSHRSLPRAQPGDRLSPGFHQIGIGSTFLMSHAYSAIER